jgi:orotidine-5'-phosphate decarboxylase
LKDKIIIALDTVDKQEALRLVGILSPLVRIFKVGSVLFSAYGPEIIKEIRKKGAGVFLDLKFHDIPNVVARAVENAAEFGVDMLTVHTLGGEGMLRAAVKAVQNIKPGPRILGVTVLTSLADKDLKRVGLKENCLTGVKRLALLAAECGCDGIVASAMEVKTLRKILPPSTLIVTPGIRPEGSATGDQKRAMTPKEAIMAGSDYLVIGRPVTQAKNPAKAVEGILKDING